MKLIQLNIWGGRLEYRSKTFLKASLADVICLQEAVSVPQGKAGLFFLPLEDIQDAAGLKYMIFGPAFSFNFMSRTAGFGNAILSRLPIKKSEVVFVYQEHTPDFDYVTHGSSNMRNFVHAVIKIDGKDCNVITYHGYWINEHKNGTEETLRQMKQLGEYIDSLNGPVILTGDFNLVPHSESIQEINKRLRNLSVEYKLKTTRTTLTTKNEVCDYIFVNDKVKVNNFYASDEIVSDHKALILDFNV